jgi:hypothetical protein
MDEYALEFRLAWCVAVNALVFGAGYFFAARRITASRSQAALDAVLIGYAVQYAAVGLPGLVGLLYPAVVTAIAVIVSGLMLLASVRRPLLVGPFRFNSPAIACLSVLTFASGFVLAFAHSQASLPVYSNDALTYHFPAAVDWLQSHRITPFQPWFFNPANAYSPLAGSAFIAWLIIPFHGDAVARFVEVPALLAVCIGVYRLGRELGGTAVVAAILAAAAVLCRPLFLPCMMGKDDLFVVLFLLAGLVAMSHARSAEPLGTWRLGLAIGLLLAVKVTAVLVVPTLLLAIDCRRWRVWLGAAACAAAVAGPWYVRTWFATGNPVFPLRIGSVFPGLFTTARSDDLAGPGGLRFIAGGAYSVPPVCACLLIAAWIATLVFDRRWWQRPLTRAAVLGPVLGIAVFYFRSPFPEVRFIIPLIATVFALTAATMTRALPSRWAIAVAAFVGAASLATVSVASQAELIAERAGIATVVTALVIGGVRLGAWLGPQRRLALLYLPLLAISAGFVYVEWMPYVTGCRAALYAHGSAYGGEYPAEFPVWKFVDEKVPPDAVVAYSGMYLIYPMMNPALQRRLVYVPTRDGITTMASLPYLGDRLSGERVVKAATAATIASPDAEGWLRRMKSSGAAWLVVGATGGITAPELAIARAHPEQFDESFSCSGGTVFSVRR